MIFGYRIVKTKWAEQVFDGEGARLYGGRWNSRGQRCVYLASSESLAMLEVLVHLQHSATLEHYSLFRLAIPESSILLLELEDWPSDWQSQPAPVSTAEIGDQWLRSAASAALAVPSTIVPREHNYLLNLHHADCRAILASAEPLAFAFDLRLVTPN